MSMMVSFVLSFFPRDVLDEILNLIESVSEDFPSYSLLSRRKVFFHLREINRNPTFRFMNGERLYFRLVLQFLSADSPLVSWCGVK